MTRFQQCLQFTLTAEGGFVDNPDDPGGATNKGITLRTFQRYRPKATIEDLKAIDDETVVVIYNDGYWLPCHCAALPTGADLMVFDMAVNAGVRASTLMLQRAVDATPDGFIGPATLKSARSHQPSELVALLEQAQLRYYQSLPGWQHFSRGWSSRLALRAAAASQALDPTPSDPLPHPPGSVA